MKLCYFSLSTQGMELLSESFTLSSARTAFIGLDIDYHPKKNIMVFDFKNYLKKIDFSKYSAIFVSANTFSLSMAKDLYIHVNKKAPVIIGGHAINLENVEQTIENGFCDAAIVGGMDAAREFIKSYGINYNLKKENSFFYLEVKKVAPNGFYYRANNQIIGKGTSCSQFSEPIILFKGNDNLTEIELLLSNTCPNNCGYCTSEKSNITAKKEDYIKKIKEYKTTKIIRLTLYDNNPLCKSARENTIAFFEMYEKEIGPLPNTVLYCDPSTLADEYDTIADILKKHFKAPNNNLFVGRETCSQEIAEKIGRNYNRQPRTTKQLENEKNALIKLSKELSNANSGKLNFTIIINYIITPFETEDSINNLILESLELRKHKRVIIRSNYLWPFSGTSVAKKYEELFMPYEMLDVTLKYFQPGGINVWNSNFLDYCFAVKAKLDFDSNDVYFSYYNLAMLHLIRDITFKKYFPNKTINEIAKLIPESQKNLKKELIDFGKKIDEEKLYFMGKKDKSRFLELTHTMFLCMPGFVVKEIKKEYEKIIEFKEDYFNKKNA
ncbi:MAG: hypothetical protein V1859_03475 [archaeon]